MHTSKPCCGRETAWCWLSAAISWGNGSQ